MEPEDPSKKLPQFCPPRKEAFSAIHYVLNSGGAERGRVMGERLLNANGPKIPPSTRGDEGWGRGGVEGGRARKSVAKKDASFCTQEMLWECFCVLVFENCKLQNLLASPIILFGSAGSVRIFRLVTRPKKSQVLLVPRGGR